MVLAIISAVFTGPEVFRSLAVAYAFRAESVGLSEDYVNCEYFVHRNSHA